MSNPNNNKNFNDEALRINRALKKENDALSELVDEFENYAKICRQFNVFNQAMNDLGETMDFRLSELNEMDYLRYSLMHNLGFEKSSESYYSDYKIPDIKEK